MKSKSLLENTAKSVDVTKLRIDIKDAFFKKYCVYRIGTDRRLWNKLDLIDFAASCGKVENGHTYLYILTEENRPTVKRRLEELEVPFDVIGESRTVPAKLLVNAICRDKGFTCLAGKNFWIEPVTFYREDKQVRAVDIPEIWLSNENVISIHTSRFVMYNEHYRNLPAYRYEEGRLVRDYAPDDSCYVQHGEIDRRTGKQRRAKALNYLSTNDGAYYSSRAALIQLILMRLNKKFSGLLTADFEQAVEIVSFPAESQAKYKKMLDDNIRMHFSEGVWSDAKEFLEIYGIKPIKTGPRIMLVDEKEAYEEGKDEYVPSLDVQHITRPLYLQAKEEIDAHSENISGEGKGSKNLLMAQLARCCLTELAIKQDVAGGVDSFSGYLTSFREPAVFIIKNDNFCNYVRKDGILLDFGRFDLADPRYPSWAPDTLLDVKEKHIVIKDKAILGLEATGISILPDKSSGRIISEKHGKVRNKEYLEPLFGGMIGAHIYELGGEIYYYSSVVGKGMKPNINNASTLMRIVEYVPCDNYDWFLPYVAVTYINAGDRFTKYPYLFKYLEEWMNVN